MTFSVSQPYFNPRSPHGERRSSQPSPFPLHNFNPRSPHGERPPADRRAAGAADFNPRSPHGERRFTRGVLAAGTDFNPRSPHGERRSGMYQTPAWRKISIHAPRTGSDFWGGGLFLPPPISIHAPRTGSDLPWPSADSQAVRDFNPRSPHGERLDGVHRVLILLTISIHAPRTGSDSPTWA